MIRHQTLGMPRPAWTYYFMPADVKVRKIKRDLDKLEDSFFAGAQFKF